MCPRAASNPAGSGQVGRGDSFPSHLARRTPSSAGSHLEIAVTIKAVMRSNGDSRQDGLSSVEQWLSKQVFSTPFHMNAAPAAEPVLRWAGSKRKVAPVLSDNCPDAFARYIEPFAGSASLFFRLQPKVAILGDMNPEVTATYLAIRDTPDLVWRLLTGIPPTKEAYLKLRSLEPQGLSQAQRAARLIFLMKGSFNGVYRTNRLGQFNVPFGTRVYRLPTHEDLLQVSRALAETQVRLGDYREWLIDEAKASDFVYLDPPYSSSTRFRGEYGYASAFRDEHIIPLVRVCNALSAKGAFVMLSYKPSTTLEEELRKWNLRRLNIPRSVGGKVKTRSLAPEILATNY